MLAFFFPESGCPVKNLMTADFPGEKYRTDKPGHHQNDFPVLKKKKVKDLSSSIQSSIPGEHVAGYKGTIPRDILVQRKRNRRMKGGEIEDKM